jgi:hypothetical protein
MTTIAYVVRATEHLQAHGSDEQWIKNIKSDFKRLQYGVTKIKNTFARGLREGATFKKTKVLTRKAETSLKLVKRGYDVFRRRKPPAIKCGAQGYDKMYTDE